MVLTISESKIIIIDHKFFLRVLYQAGMTESSEPSYRYGLLVFSSDASLPFERDRLSFLVTASFSCLTAFEVSD